MVKRVVDPSKVTITYFHCSDPFCSECSHKQKTKSWLDEIIKKGEKIPPVVVIRDPKDGRLLVYDGNVRVIHAIENSYKIEVLIIFDQKDLDDYLKERIFTPLWFGIRNFEELLEYMRIYAAIAVSGNTCKAPFPEEFHKKIMEKYSEYQRELERERERLFGWSNDD